MSSLKQHPIGIFDSGVGGTSIFKEIHKRLPSEDKLYLADSKNAPYGNREIEDIINLCEKNTRLLLQENCKVIVVACNTATTMAIDFLRKKYTVPFIGIEPAIKPAALNSKTKTIGILATKGTLSSQLFARTSELFAQNIEVIEIIGTGLVERIEAGKASHEETIALLKHLLQPMLEKKIDYLVLGCSHYPYLIPVLKKILPAEVNIIDSGEAVARQLEKVLREHDLLNLPTHSGSASFFTNIKETGVLKNFVESPDLTHSVQYLDF